MHCVGTAALQNVDQQILVEICVFVCVSGKQICVVSHLHILRMAILFRIHRNRGNPHLTCGAHYAKSDFTAIRHQKFVDIFRHNVKFGRTNEKSGTRFPQKTRDLFVRLHKRYRNLASLRLGA